MRKLLLLAALCAACGDTTIVDPMERQPKFKPFAANPQYADGRAMRQPPEGTVRAKDRPRGRRSPPAATAAETSSRPSPSRSRAS